MPINSQICMLVDANIAIGYDDDDYFDNTIPDANTIDMRSRELMSAMTNLYFYRKDLNEFIPKELLDLAISYVEDFDKWNDRRADVVSNEKYMANSRIMRTHEIMRRIFAKKIPSKRMLSDADKLIKYANKEIDICNIMEVQGESLKSTIDDIIAYIRAMQADCRRNNLESYNENRFKAMTLICECDSRYRFVVEKHEDMRALNAEQAVLFAAIESEKDGKP